VKYIDKEEVEGPLHQTGSCSQVPPAANLLHSCSARQGRRPRKTNESFGERSRGDQRGGAAVRLPAIVRGTTERE